MNTEQVARRCVWKQKLMLISNKSAGRQLFVDSSSCISRFEILKLSNRMSKGEFEQF
jgi:hypothetical protein